MVTENCRLAGDGAIRLVGFPGSYALDDWEMKGPLSVQTYVGAVATPVKHLRVEGRPTVSGAIYDSVGRLVVDSERKSHRWRVAINPETLQSPLPMSVLKGNYVYAGLAIPPFGHVLIEFLSRLWWIESLGDLSRRHLLLHPYRGTKGAPLDLPLALKPLVNWFRRDSPTSYLRTAWVSAVIDLLGLRPNNVSIIPVRGARIARLTVGSPVISVNGAAHRAFPRIYDRLADRVCADMRPDGRRIYLSRAKLGSSKRRAGNETELEALLVQHGFQIVYPEMLPLAEQIKMMRHADVVAGCGGSAMHMLCFARPGTRALVLDVRAVNNQFAIEQVRGVRATHLWMGTDSPYQGRSEWTIDLDLVRRHLHSVIDPAV